MTKDLSKFDKILCYSDKRKANCRIPRHLTTNSYFMKSNRLQIIDPRAELIAENKKITASIHEIARQNTPVQEKPKRKYTKRNG